MKHGIKLLKAALHDPDPRVRQGVSAALAKVAQQRQELLFGKTSTSETKPAEASQASEPRGPGILEQIKAAGSRVSAGDLAGLPQLKEGLKSSQIEIQIAAINGLGEASKQVPSALDDLKTALAETKSDTLKLKLTGELAKMQDPTALADIKNYVKSEDQVDRMYAAEVLGQTGKDGVSDELVAALDDPDALVRVHAATGIIRALQAQALARTGSGWKADDSPAQGNDTIAAGLDNKRESAPATSVKPSSGPEATKDGPNQEILKAGRKKAAETGRNPVFYANGNIIESLIHFENNQIALNDKDMLVNAGTDKWQVLNVVLMPGEWAVSSKGKLVKQKTKLK